MLPILYSIIVYSHITHPSIEELDKTMVNLEKIKFNPPELKNRVEIIQNKIEK
jgi:hypothetical protein